MYLNDDFNARCGAIPVIKKSALIELPIAILNETRLRNQLKSKVIEVDPNKIMQKCTAAYFLPKLI